jgi:hypothetical protein
MSLFLFAQPEVQGVKYDDTQVRNQLKKVKSRLLLNLKKKQKAI